MVPQALIIKNRYAIEGIPALIIYQLLGKDMKNMSSPF
jgi:hypothetical protein